MAEDIISTLDTGDLNEFKKDFTELIRVHSGINKEYSKSGKDIDKYIAEFKKVVNLFNGKYKKLVLSLKQTTEELQLRISVKEKAVKDVFANVASRLNGLNAIGATDFGRVKLEETDKFSKELDNVKDKMFLSYHEKEITDNIFLESSQKGLVEIHYGEEIANERSPEFKLCSYYAVKNGIGELKIYDKLCAMGFVEMPLLEKVRKFLKKFDPRIEE